MKRQRGNMLPLGVSIEGENVNFSIQGEPGSHCKLYLYSQWNEKLDWVFEMEEDSEIKGLYYIGFSKFDFSLNAYNFQINEMEVVDIYTKEVYGRNTWGNEIKPIVRGNIWGSKGLVEEISWVNKPEIDTKDVIAYRVHVRGFTNHLSAPVKRKGTFLGLVERRSYLEALGINQIQLLPSFEFIEEGVKLNYWGYTSGYYMAPKSAYTSGESSIYEFAYMVNEFHKKGIEIVLDMPFGNEVSIGYQIECFRHYVLNYHIDGFVVNSYITNIEEIKKDPILKYVKFITQQQDFQNTMRKFLKGDENMVKEVMWSLKAPTLEDGNKGLAYNYMTNHNGFTISDLVSYDGKHNEENGERNQDGTEYNYSWNCGMEGKTRKRLILELRKKQVRNGWALLLLSQGTPCILSGDEMGNSQKGNNNPYCQDNEISWIDWGLKNKNKELLNFVTKLIKLRKKYTVLHQGIILTGSHRSESGMPDVSFHGEEAWMVFDGVASRQVGVMYCSKETEKENCYIAYNMHWQPHTFALPTLGAGKVWREILDTDSGVIGKEEILDNQRTIRVPERTIKLFVSEQI